MRPLYRNILISIVAILVIGGMIILVVMQNSNTNTSTNTNVNIGAQNTNTVANTNTTLNVNLDTNTNTTTNTSTNINSDVTPATDQSDEEALMRLSILLVDRYGTYSNRNNFENITNLEVYMTDSFKSKSAQFISERQAEGIPDDFYSIVTNALVADVTAYTKNKSATVDVSARRVETQTGAEQKVFTQHAIVTFQSVAGNWKVDSIDWQ
ncbi:MAG: hypothetical protein KIH62_001370 [Candidatus Kerfeldbacteria bacterium]|nr:hypothetical protein [Candidatus Kerfeldbacteria bacterium]